MFHFDCNKTRFGYCQSFASVPGCMCLGTIPATAFQLQAHATAAAEEAWSNAWWWSTAWVCFMWYISLCISFC